MTSSQSLFCAICLLEIQLPQDQLLCSVLKKAKNFKYALVHLEIEGQLSFTDYKGFRVAERHDSFADKGTIWIHSALYETDFIDLLILLQEECKKSVYSESGAL